MQLAHTHLWDVTPAEAIAIQQDLRNKVVVEDRFGKLKTAAGVDVGFEQNGKITRAAVAVLQLPDLTRIASAVVRQPTNFPYVPGLLSFREVPAILEALEQLDVLPDILLCDGQGLAHPRRFGLACHLGVLTDLPAIGVAKTRLVGTHDEVPAERGFHRPLIHQGEIVGAVLRTRDNVKPLYVSVGHRITLNTALKVVIGCTPKYRLPETTRHAHKLASG